MEIVQYVRWTAPGEEKEFLELAKQYKNDSEFIEVCMKKFSVDKITVRVALLRYRKKIEDIRNK